MKWYKNDIRFWLRNRRRWFFDVVDFDCDFAYTMDGEKVWEFQYEYFNAAASEITVKGKNAHPENAKNKMINAIGIAVQFINAMP